MRKHTFSQGEYYHIYNRGVDKRDIILDKEDLFRFYKSLVEFNTEKPIGSIYQKSFKKSKLSTPSTKLVEIIAYCINPNHFHLLITPVVEKGIEKFMQRMAGYTRYFNEKYKRSGVLFQGKFKSKHVENNNYLLHLSCYINHNNLDASLKPLFTLSFSSLGEYKGLVSKDKSICNADIILSQFKNKEDYTIYGEKTWLEICSRKEELKSLEFNV